ncbi:MAG: GyrI-like domain-containing protein [Deltaproteobacteria bacterium]|nr:GyrI-like domain-containing protein [Deltaproteobacteria bacterium]
MKTMRFVLAGVLILLLIVLGVLSYYGLFTSPAIEEKQSGSYLLVYAKHEGDYKQTGKKMDEIYYSLKNVYGIPSTRGFGLYYDDPQVVAKENLRSLVGSIVDDDGQAESTAVKEKYSTKRLDAMPAVIATFPYKGMTSIFIGMLKVYPQLKRYFISKGYDNVNPIMEIYDIQNGKIEYIVFTGGKNGVFDEMMKNAQ